MDQFEDVMKAAIRLAAEKKDPKTLTVTLAKRPPVLQTP